MAKMAIRMNMLEDELATRGRAYLESLRGKVVTVVGLARSGMAAVRLLHTAGVRVIATDTKPLSTLGSEVRDLARLGVRVLVGGVYPEAVQDAALVVVSPGVPLASPQLTAAQTVGTRVIGEMELGWRAMEAETLAITGTNGKTTTTTLTGALLSEQARPVLVGGNIGTPLAAHALTFPADGLVVCEASSFQLETTEAFHPRVAVVLNVTPDHLDRHGSFNAYVEAKARIFLNQTEADCAVLNADDDVARSLAARTRATVVWFSRTALGRAWCVRPGRLDRGQPRRARRADLAARRDLSARWPQRGKRAGGHGLRAVDRRRAGGHSARHRPFPRGTAPHRVHPRPQGGSVLQRLQGHQRSLDPSCPRELRRAHRPHRRRPRQRPGLPASSPGRAAGGSSTPC